MRDVKVYQEGYPYTSSAKRVLTINTNTPVGNHHLPTSHLISPPESANGVRHNSCWSQDVFQDTPSSFHPNTPVQQLVSQEETMIDPNNALRIYANMDLEDVKYPMPTPSPGGFNDYNQNHCSSPGYQSPLSSQTPSHGSHEQSFYTNSSSLLSTTQDWNTSHLSHASCSEDSLSNTFSSLYMVPSEGSSFIPTDTTGYDPLPSCIAPVQAIHDPSQDFAMSFHNESHWGSFHAPVNDCSMLPSSSPSMEMSMSPTTLDSDSFNRKSEYCKSESSPDPKPITSRSTSRNTKTRREKKTSSRLQTASIKALNGSCVVVSMDERANNFQVAKDRGHVPVRTEKPFKCSLSTCRSKFDRAEHCKRHEETHLGIHPYKCLVALCDAGKKKDGSQNRRDNSRYHAWTHVKAALNKDPLVVERMRSSGNRPRNHPRNRPTQPQVMMELAAMRFSAEDKTTLLEYMNKEAGKEYGVHIDWKTEGCPTYVCVGKPACKICRNPTKDKRKK